MSNIPHTSPEQCSQVPGLRGYQREEGRGQKQRREGEWEQGRNI